MIGKINTGSDFGGLIGYCLEDKRDLSEAQKRELSEQEQVEHLNRAEVIHYNNCYGDRKELTQQFREVQKANQRVEKPLFHISLRLPDEEKLTKNQWINVAEQCAEEFHFSKNQYIAVLHKDTKGQHIHIVANRVGTDGKLTSDSNNYQRMASFCRKMEQEYHLTKVLSPRKFLSKEARKFERQNSRHLRLKTAIRSALRNSTSVSDFTRSMEKRGYQVEKGRGIAFIDNRKVRIKGSELGFSLLTIEQVINLNNQAQALNREQDKIDQDYQLALNDPSISREKKIYLTFNPPVSDAGERAEIINKFVGKVLDGLFKVEQADTALSSDWISKEFKRKKKKRQSP